MSNLNSVTIEGKISNVHEVIPPQGENKGRAKFTMLCDGQWTRAGGKPPQWQVFVDAQNLAVWDIERVKPGAIITCVGVLNGDGTQQGQYPYVVVKSGYNFKAYVPRGEQGNQPYDDNQYKPQQNNQQSQGQPNYQQQQGQPGYQQPQGQPVYQPQQNQGGARI